MVSVSRRKVLVGLGGVAAVLGTGVGYRTIRDETEEREHPPPGEMVDVGGHRLHLYPRGEAGDRPTVVIEAGSGAWSLDWHHVQAELSATTRVVTYDRAGYGWSDPGPTPRTARRIADELLRALSTAGIDGPYVLVGHSFGGYTPRMIADRVPEEVMGIVLVDSRQEDMRTRFPPEATQRPPLGLFRTLARFGVVDLTIDVMGADAPGVPPTIEDMAPDVRAAYLAIGFQPAYFRALVDEGEVIEESDAQVRRTGPLGDLPLTVLSHGVPDMFEGLPEERAEEAERVWQEGQRDLVEISTNSTHRLVEDAGHNIQFDRPDLVIESIREIVTGARD